VTNYEQNYFTMVRLVKTLRFHTLKKEQRYVSSQLQPTMVKDKDPTWHNIVSFNKTAELIAEHFHKGKEILVEGKQEHNKYEKDGKTTYYSSVALIFF